MKGIELLVVLAIIAVIVLVAYNSCGCGAKKERLTQEYKPYEAQSKSSVLEGETPYANVFY